MNQETTQTPSSDSSAIDSNNTVKPSSKLKHPLTKTLLFGFICAILFAILLPFGKIAFWQYSFFIGSVPSTLLWDLFNIQNPLSVILAALFNVIILLIPYFYYLKTQQQYWWLYFSISLYSFINASLGFTIIISVKDFAH